MTPDANRTKTALYWMAWSLKECDGMPIEQIARKLGKSTGEVLELLLIHPRSGLATQGSRKFL